MSDFSVRFSGPCARCGAPTPLSTALRKRQVPRHGRLACWRRARVHAWRGLSGNRRLWLRQATQETGRVDSRDLLPHDQRPGLSHHSLCQCHTAPFRAAYPPPPPLQPSTLAHTILSVKRWLRLEQWSARDGRPGLRWQRAEPRTAAARRTPRWDNYHTCAAPCPRHLGPPSSAIDPADAIEGEPARVASGI